MRHVSWSSPLGILDVEIGLILEQNSHQAQVVLDDGVMQGCLVPAVTDVDVSLLLANEQVGSLQKLDEVLLSFLLHAL